VSNVSGAPDAEFAIAGTGRAALAPSRLRPTGARSTRTPVTRPPPGATTSRCLARAPMAPSPAPGAASGCPLRVNANVRGVSFFAPV
jgi:hypothetical protein